MARRIARRRLSASRAKPLYPFIVHSIRRRAPVRAAAPQGNPMIVNSLPSRARAPLVEAARA
jgi:hypothetical protein